MFHPPDACGAFRWPPQPTRFCRLQRQPFQQLLSVLTGARRRYGRYLREPMGDMGEAVLVPNSPPTLQTLSTTRGQGESSL